jgi:hypothetical protein
MSFFFRVRAVITNAVARGEGFMRPTNRAASSIVQELDAGDAVDSGVNQRNEFTKGPAAAVSCAGS